MYQNTISMSGAAQARIALVKQSVYGDLYVSEAGNSNAEALLFSSLMRVGPIGLFTQLNTDFYIVAPDKAKECQMYLSTIKDFHKENYEQIRQRLQLNPSSDRRKLGISQAKCEQNVADIDWGKYDIVISINVSLPLRIIKKYVNTLFVYMPGEANKRFARWSKWGYDAVLNQCLNRSHFRWIGDAIDFPYTFLSSGCLLGMMSHMKKHEIEKNGIYSEVNMSSERPVKEVPHCLKKAEDAGIRIHLHKEDIRQNLKMLCASKYFVKVTGRKIRGNSVMEAISCGCLILANPDLLYDPILIGRPCFVQDCDEVMQKIRQLEENPELFECLRKDQQQRLDDYGFRRPLQALLAALDQKRSCSGLQLWLLRKSAWLRYYVDKNFRKQK